MYVLEDLWRGELHPNELPPIRRDYAATIRALSASEEKFAAMLSDEQKTMFNVYLKDQGKIASITDCETFVKGFQLGVKIMIDVLADAVVNKERGQK